MDREEYRDLGRKRFAIALGLSAAIHLIAFAMVRLSVPVFERGDEGRALQVVELPDQWTERAMEVVPLETVAGRTRSGGAGPETAATSARVEASRPGAGGADAAVGAITPMTAAPGAAPAAPAIDPSLASATPTPAPRVATQPSNHGIVHRPIRGVVQRPPAAAAFDDTGLDFVAASDAAREAERERGGDGWGGPGGIGISILGGGDHIGHGHGPGEYCPPPTTLPGIGGLGGIPFGGKGRGIIGRRPPLPGGGAAINRTKPGRPF